MKGRTTIIIAHRMSTIEKCNKIFVLENGKVLEEGGLSELK
jgi:ABC-type multidrug transport system fused ATPase/permease subunit